MDTQSPSAQPDPPRSTDGHAAPQRASYRSGFFFGTLSFLSVAVIGVISTVLTSRLYGVRIIGQFALVLAPVAALWILSTIKEQQALIKEITGLPPRHPRVTQLFAAVFTFSSGLTAVVALLDAVVCWFVFRGPLHAPELIPPVLVNIAGYALVTNTGWNIDSIFSAFVAGRQLFWVRLHEGLAFLVLGMTLGVVWHSVWGLVIATIGASLSALIHRAIAARRFVKTRLSLAEYRAGMGVLPELLRFGLKATPGQIAQGVSMQAGIWALGTVAPINVVGAYSRALTIPQRLQQASMRINEVLYPTLVKRHTQGDGEGFDRALVDSIRYEMVGMLLIAATLGGAANSVMNIFGPGFGRAAQALIIVALYPALASITVTQTQALWAINRPRRTSVTALARLAVTLGLLIVLTPAIGVLGPAIALVAGYLAAILLGGIVLHSSMTRPLRATWPLRERFALLAAYAAGFAAAHATEQAVPSAAGLLLCLPASVLAYAVVFLACGGANQRDRQRLREVTASTRSWRQRRVLARQVPSGARQPAADMSQN
jgi:O-antigen/teichoic acid export membrane protein